MSDDFPHGFLGSAQGAFVVTPSDTEDLPAPIRALTIGTAGGAVKYIHPRTGETHTTGPLPLNTYALEAKRILASGTTATGLTGWI